jgi:RNA polymerase sigma-70 factor (ECF subfamily)
METSRVLRGKARARKGERAREDAMRVDLAAAYDAYAAPLYRYLLALLGHAQEAEDALQEVFLAVMRRRGPDDIRDLRAYLFQAARTQAVLILRKRRKRDRESAAAAMSWIDVDACGPDDRNAAIDVDRALRQLPAQQREVIVLKLSEGLTFREIARMLDIPLGTAASRYRLALSRLRALLEGGEDYG